MPMYLPDGSRVCAFVFLLGAISQGALAFSQELPDAPSVVQNASFSSTEGSDAASDAPKSPDTTSPGSSDGKFLSRWAKRGLRDQAGITQLRFIFLNSGGRLGCQLSL